MAATASTGRNNQFSDIKVEKKKPYPTGGKAFRAESLSFAETIRFHRGKKKKEIYFLSVFSFICLYMCMCI